MTTESKAYKYFAFISYSRKDSKVAAWLQKRLEWFRFPVKLVPADRTPYHHKYVRDIYRDKTNLEVTDEHYWKNIRRALEESRYLIVLCSPNSAIPRPEAPNHPVDMEVAHFMESHGGDSSLVVPIILSGNITSAGEDAAFCPALHDLGSALIDRNLPTMVPDVGASEAEGWEQGFVMTISYLLRLDRDVVGTHIQSETRKEAQVLRRWLYAVTILTLASLVLGGLAWKNKKEAESNEERAIAGEALANENARQEAAARRLAEENELKAKDNEQTAKKEKKRADEKAEEVRARLREAAYSDWRQAVKLLEDGRQSEAFAHLARAHDYNPDFTMPVSTAMLALQDWKVLHPSTDIKAHSSSILEMHLSDNDKELVTVGADGYVKRWNLDESKPIHEFQAHEEGVLCAAFSPDKTQMLTGAGDGATALWDISSGSLLKRFGGYQSGVISSVCFSPDGKHILTASSNGTARLHLNQSAEGIELNSHAKDATSGSTKKDSLLNDAPAVTTAIFSPDGSQIVTGDKNGFLHFWDAKNGRHVRPIAAHLAPITHIEYSPDQKTIVTASIDLRAKLWSAQTGEFLRQLHGHESAVVSARFSPFLGDIITASLDHTSRAWHVDSGSLVHADKFHKGSVLGAIVSPNLGRSYLTISSDGTALLINRNGELEAKCEAHDAPIDKAVFNKSGRKFATGSEDGRLMIWEPTRMHFYAEELYLSEIGRYQELGDAYAVEISPDGSKAITLRNGGMGMLWDTSTGANNKIIAEDLGRSFFSGGKWSPDGKTFAAISNAGMALFWNSEKKRWREPEIVNTPPMTDVEWSPDGRHIAIVCKDSSVRIVTGPRIVTTPRLSGIEEGVSAIKFSPNSSKLGVGNTTGRITVYNSGTVAGRDLQRVHTSKIKALSFDSNTKRIASASSDMTLSVMDLESEEVDKYEHKSPIQSVQFSNEDRFILTVAGNTAFLIDTVVKRTVADLKGHKSIILCASFSPDGKFIVTGSADYDVRVWDAKTGTLVGLLRGTNHMVTGLSFSSQNPRFLATNPRAPPRVWELPELSSSTPSWWRVFLKCVGGREFGASGEISLIQLRELQIMREDVLRQIGEDRSRLALLARWHLSPPDQRTVRPDDPRILSDVVMDFIRDPMTQNLLLIPSIQPDHPLAAIAICDKLEIRGKEMSDQETSKKVHEMLKFAVEALPDDREMRLNAALLLDKKGFPEFAVQARRMAAETQMKAIMQPK